MPITTRHLDWSDKKHKFDDNDGENTVGLSSCCEAPVRCVEMGMSKCVCTKCGSWMNLDWREKQMKMARAKSNT